MIKLTWIGAALVLITSISTGGDLEEEIRDLSNEDSVVRGRAAERLVVLKKEALPLLRRAVFPNVQAELEDLGHVEYKVRQEASQRLIRAGTYVLPQIKEHLKNTKDPEVQAQCQKIIAALSKKNADEGRRVYFMRCFRIMMDCGLDPGKDTDKSIFLFFFSRRKFIETAPTADLRKALHAVRPHKEYVATLIPLIQKPTGRNTFSIIAEELLKTAPEKTIPILKKLEADGDVRETVRTLLLPIRRVEEKEAVLAQVKNLKPKDKARFLARFSKWHGFRKVYRGHAKVFLETDHFYANFLGLLLIDKKPDQYLDLAMAVIKRIKRQETDYRFAERFRRVGFSREKLIAHLPTFLKSDDEDVVQIGLDLIKDDPARYRNEIQAIFQRPIWHQYVYRKVISFLKDRYPEALNDAERALIKQVQKATPGMRMNDLIAAAETLHRYLGYRGDEMQDTWLRLIKHKDMQDFFRRAPLTRNFDVMNIRPDLVAEQLKPGDLIEKKDIDYLLRDPDYHKKVIPALERFIHASTKGMPFGQSVSRSVVEGLIKHCPGQLEKTLPRYLKQVASRSRSFHHWPASDYPLAILMSNHPKCADVLLRRLPKERGLKRVLLLRALMYTELDRDQKEIFRKHFDLAKARAAGVEEQSALIMAGLAQGLGREAVHPLFLSLLEISEERFEDKSWEIRAMMDLLDERDRQLLNKLNLQLARKKTTNRFLKYRAVLRIEPENKVVLQRLRSLALEGEDLGQARQALSVLSTFGEIPTIPNKRMELLWSNSVAVWMAEGSDENALTGAKLAPAFIKQIFDNHDNLGDLMWERPAVQKLLVPVLLKIVQTNRHDDRWSAAHDLQSSGQILANYLDELRPSVDAETDPKILKKLIRAIGKIGPRAKSMVPLIKKKMVNSDPEVGLTCLFALGRISASAAERRAFTKRLVAAHPTHEIPEHHDDIVWMAGQIREFDNMIHPWLTKILLDEKQWYTERRYAIYGLSRRRPLTKQTLDAFEKVLRESQTFSHFRHNHEIIPALLWAIRQEPKRTAHLLPLVEKLPIEAHRSSSFWHTRKALMKAKAEAKE